MEDEVESLTIGLVEDLESRLWRLLPPPWKNALDVLVEVLQLLQLLQRWWAA